MPGVRAPMVGRSGIGWTLGCVLTLWLHSTAAWGAAAHPSAFTDPGELPQLRLVEGSEALPLKHTDVRAEITGVVAEVEVKQTYRNTHAEAIEAVYTFPLPENAAVRDMEIVIGDRIIRAEIMKREAARKTYEAARERGNTAALLEQERTNIFTQSVANIAPGEDIDVVLRYVQDITYDAGEFEFVFPMVVGPRYTAGSVDADRITPSVSGEGTRTGHDITVAVTINAGMPIRDVTVPTHASQTRREESGALSIALAESKSIPNRDFVLRYRADGPQLRSTLFVAPGDDERYFTLLMQPPTADVDALVGKRELIFVVDVSGSMHGTPLAMCKHAMRTALRRLRPVDTFNVIVFAGSTGQAFDRPVPANHENTAAAEAFVAGMRAGGGTEILNAVDAAISPPVGQGRHRYAFFLTDGFVNIEDAVYERTRRWVAELAHNQQRARVFAMGTGSSPNRELLGKLTKAGEGLAVYVSNRDDPLRAVNRFYEAIDHAVFTDPHIEWGAAKVSDMHPAQLPDLFVSRPGVVHGRMKGALPDSMTLVGTLGGKAVRVPVRIETLEERPGAVQAQLWARAQVEDLMLAAAWDGDARAQQITAVGLEHRLVTPYTSFVAVDQSRVVGDGDPARIDQPVDAAEAVDMTMAGAPVMMAEEDSPSFASESARDNDEEHLGLTGRGGAGCAHCNTTGGGGFGAPLILLIALGLRRRRNGRRDRTLVER